MKRRGIFDQGGVLVSGRLLGKGGEGAVYELLGRPGFALKLYKTPDREREAKVLAMVSGCLASTCPSAAVPRSVARDVSGAFVGFTMRRVDNARPLHDLYGATSRRTHFPKADWRMIARTAANVARAVAEVHAAGTVIGDVNHSSMLVTRRSMVTLIDTDSWQIGDAHPCRVGVPEYTPPELQGHSLDGLFRSHDHDAFGLAVLLAQLIFLGRHPFAGVPIGKPLSLPEAIARYQYTYTRVREVRLRPPPGTLLLSDLPPGLRVGFERAFGCMLGPRYSAASWAAVLGAFERSLVNCPRDPRHHFPPDVQSCPWCRIEQLTCRPVFGTQAQSHSLIRSGKVDPELDDVRVFLDELDGRQLARIMPPSPKFAVRRSNKAAAFAKEKGGAAHAALLRSVAKLAGGVSNDEFTRRHTAADLALVRVLADWRRRVGVEQVLAGAAKLRHDLALFRKQEATFAGKPLAASANEKVSVALRSTSIANARVPGIGGGRLTSLVAAGVRTAADVAPRRLASVPGMSSQRIAALLVWQDEVAASAATSLDLYAASSCSKLVQSQSAALASAKKSLLDKQRTLRTALIKVDQLATLTDAVVEHARLEVSAAASDLCFLQLPLPGQGSSSPRENGLRILEVGHKKKDRGLRKAKAAAKKSPISCPKCASSMTRRWGAAGSRRAMLGCTRYPACDGRRTLGGHVIV